MGACKHQMPAGLAKRKLAKLPIDEVDVIELHTHHTVPEWIRDKYLRSGYRVQLPMRQCVRSLFMLHNETWNVWTHLLGWFFFLWLTVYSAFYLTPPEVRNHTMNTVVAHLEQMQQTKDMFATETMGAIDSVLNHSALLTEVNSRLAISRKCIGGRMSLAAKSLRQSLEQYLAEMDPLLQTGVDFSSKMEELVFAAVNAHIQPDESEVISSIVRGRLAATDSVIRTHLQSVQFQLQLQVDAIMGVKAAILQTVEEVRLNLIERYQVDDIEDIQAIVTQFFHDIFDERVACLQCGIKARVDGATQSLASAGETVRGKVEWLLNGGYSLTGPFKVSRWPIVVFCITAQACMLASTLFHLFSCNSEHACLCFGYMDFSGISILIGGSFLPILYYHFYLLPLTRNVYIGIVCCITAAICAATMWPRFHSDQFRYVRVVVYVGFGVFGVVPLSHLFLHHGHSEVFWTLIYEIFVMAALYLFGVAFYASRFPESWFPGKFDIWFSSHQFWHCFVFLGTYAHYTNIVRVWKACYEHDSPLSSPFLLTSESL